MLLVKKGSIPWPDYLNPFGLGFFRGGGGLVGGHHTCFVYVTYCVCRKMIVK